VFVVSAFVPFNQTIFPQNIIVAHDFSIYKRKKSDFAGFS